MCKTQNVCSENSCSEKMFPRIFVFGNFWKIPMTLPLHLLFKEFYHRFYCQIHKSVTLWDSLLKLQKGDNSFCLVLTWLELLLFIYCKTKLKKKFFLKKYLCFLQNKHYLQKKCFYLEKKIYIEFFFYWQQLFLQRKI